MSRRLSLSASLSPSLSSSCHRTVSTSPSTDLPQIYACESVETIAEKVRFKSTESDNSTGKEEELGQEEDLENGEVEEQEEDVELNSDDDAESEDPEFSLHQKPDGSTGRGPWRLPDLHTITRCGWVTFAPVTFLATIGPCATKRKRQEGECDKEEKEEEESSTSTEPSIGNVAKGRKKSLPKSPPAEDIKLSSKATPYTPHEKDLLNAFFRDKLKHPKYPHAEILEAFHAHFGDNPERSSSGMRSLMNKMRDAGELEGPRPDYFS